MFKKLQEKWGVGGFQLFLILCTFAIGGSLSGRGAKVILDLFSIENSILWGVTYFIVVSLLWPLCVITVSIFFGQFNFFKNYLKKIGKRIRILKK